MGLIKRDAAIKDWFSFLLSLQESIRTHENSELWFSMGLYVLEGPEYDLTVIRKCMSMDLSVCMKRIFCVHFIAETNKQNLIKL